MKVLICVTEAADIDDAERQAKASPAYQQILRKYPHHDWARRFVGTYWSPKTGTWSVEFEVCRLPWAPAPAMPGKKTEPEAR